ncbi:MAG: phosphoribosyltransferase family protein [bacterium]|nr:phosphoribosyltransferase family protein [bacterium]
MVEVFDSPVGKINLPANLKAFELFPLPLNRKRENWRGFNQAELLGNLVAKRFGLVVSRLLLERKLFEKSQVKLTLEQRKKNLQGAFLVVDPKKVAGKKILLFDDVWTTGATLTEAGRTLKKAGAEQVWALCLASSHRV